jgi:hypothetical protein
LVSQAPTPAQEQSAKPRASTMLIRLPSGNVAHYPNDVGAIAIFVACHVRFTLESRHVLCDSPCPLSANSGLMQCSKGRPPRGSLAKHSSKYFDYVAFDGTRVDPS